MFFKNLGWSFSFLKYQNENEKSKQPLDYNMELKIIKQEKLPLWKVFKDKTTKILETYKQSKNYFVKKNKKRSKKFCCQNKLPKCEKSIITTQIIIKEIVG